MTQDNPEKWLTQIEARATLEADSYMVTMNRFKHPLLLLTLLALVVEPSQARDLSKILESGRLSVATRATSTLIFSPDTGDLPGFCYELVSAFADSVDLEVDIATVSSFRDYWEPAMEDGTPELLSEVDLYADILTVTPRRREIVDMVPFIENTEILVGGATSRAESLEDLRGRRIAVVEGMSFHGVLETALSAAGIPFVSDPAEIRGGSIVPTSRADAPQRAESGGDLPAEERGGEQSVDSSPGDPVRLLLLPRGTRTTLLFFPDQLTQGTIDFFVLDSLSLFHQLSISQSLRTSVRPLFPLNNDVGYLAFATSPRTPELTRVLATWMGGYREGPKFQELVERYIGLPYEQYRAFLRDFPR